VGGEAQTQSQESALRLRSGHACAGMFMNPAFTFNQEMKFAGRGGEPGGRRRTTEQLVPGPDVGRAHPLGLLGLAIEAEANRLRLEGLSPRPCSGGMTQRRVIRAGRSE